MDIERVNENTLKLFITYSDIEDRGYSREEIWYNRTKGEELFWDVIGEVNTEDYFDLEGPIWIHINASEQGLEVIVTRANVPDADSSSMVGMEEHDDMASHLKEMEEVLLDSLDVNLFDEEQDHDKSITSLRFVFKDIDELIPLAKRLENNYLSTSLYKFENKYYLVIDTKTVEDINTIRNYLAVAKEFLTQSKVTTHRLEEYGQLIMKDDCFEQIRAYFS